MAHQLNLNTTALEELKAKAQALPAEKKVQASKTIDPSSSVQKVEPDAGYDGLASVTVNAISSKYIDTTDATATAQDMVAGVTAYVNGEKITGEGDPDLISSNIPSGVEIFGVTGTRPHKTDSIMLAISTNVPSGSISASNGTDTTTGTIANSECFLQVPSDGTWTINGTSGERNADTATGSLKAAANVKLTFFEATVGCYLMNDASATVTCTNGTKTYTSTGTGLHTFTVYERGTWTVSCEIDGSTWKYSPSVQTHLASYVDVFNGEVDTTLNNNSWSFISVMSNAGMASNYWAVGDTKQITIDGSVGRTTFTNFNVWAFILGFDHNSEIEGTNTIHFQIGKTGQTSSKDICLIDEKYNSSTAYDGFFTMNYSSSNSGGWKSSKMRTVLLGNNNTPASPLSGSLMAALPSDLLGVMKACTKYSDNTGGGSNTASYVTATPDYLWLLAEYEVVGNRIHSNSAEPNYQKQYTYYANGNSKVKYRHSATSSTAHWWLRSTRATTSTAFCYMYAAGGVSNAAAYYSYGLTPAFCV